MYNKKKYVRNNSIHLQFDTAQNKEYQFDFHNSKYTPKYFNKF